MTLKTCYELLKGYKARAVNPDSTSEQKWRSEQNVINMTAHIAAKEIRQGVAKPKEVKSDGKKSKG